MLETKLAETVVSIVLYVLDKTTGGALEEVGVKILQFVKNNLPGVFKLEQAKNDPERLKAAIVDKALEDRNFKIELEQLVEKFQKLENDSAKFVQNNQSGVNIKADNSHTVIGQQFFRSSQ